ncbi:hypothetical protein VUN84_08435 [Micrococcaceae bacterium Sec5.8]
MEEVSFDQDRNVTRRLTIDFNVRADAPVVTDKVGDRFWIVPIALMRRRTLVNMRITDEIGHGLPTPGIRFTQQLDESQRSILRSGATRREFRRSGRRPSAPQELFPLRIPPRWHPVRTGKAASAPQP